LEPADLDALFAEGSGEIVRWRVAAFGDDGLQTPFSPAVRFTYRPTVSGMQPVLRPGADAGLVLGSAEGGEADERPAATVQLDTPYEMMRYPLTNAAVVELANQQIAAGEWRLLEGGVVDAASGRRVVGLGDLTFGRQFAIQADGDGVRVVAGYAAHPAVGVSWYGAVLIANELSIREARTPVYEVVPDTDIPPAVAQRTEENGVIDVPDPSLLQRTEQPQAEDLSQGDPREIVDDAPAEVVYGVGVRSTRSADGYRLPHEAEWALAVSLEQSIPAGAEVTVPEARTVDGPELQGVNYLRSGDRWEDPTPPYTDQGGPTSPVGALGWSYAGGVYDLIGNVWEWTADWYSPTWYERLAGADGPTGAERVLGPRAPEPDVYGRELRAVRGTAWNTPRESVRPGNRGGFDPSATSHSIGVRLVRTIRPRRDPAEER
jgi:formylglycine-generating enzyme required for sulfatase activity